MDSLIGVAICAVSLGPDTVAPQETSGYRSNNPVLGFSHNHSSGTGGTARYGDLSGKRLVIRAPGLSPTHECVQSATRNGRPSKQAWFRHCDIADGAELVLPWGAQPSAWGRDLPQPSLSSARPR
ncbi:glycoside hydrolase domain-containing protein [Paucibacter sp. M5-1]|uniref:glycoside hydrolase domain-containing protein n=1 Tax=Paucibacter sp. M5-1 TaxID=3015998 RepID=UPI0022B8846C|nr:glycoside hydrolase domain-containing protein [Paucibacter sp. M5-1]MCZ7883035.1 hypothetical protein [Paucibacter sp. M5-1]